MNSVLIDTIDTHEGDGPEPIMVEQNAHCPDCGGQHDIEKCPKCGSWIEIGYGMAYGGMGEYKFCSNEKCDWFWKQQEGGE